MIATTLAAGPRGAPQTPSLHRTRLEALRGTQGDRVVLPPRGLEIEKGNRLIVDQQSRAEGVIARGDLEVGYQVFGDHPRALLLLQFFPDRVGALKELRRALRDGGRAGISVWCEIERCEPFAALDAAIAVALGPDAAAAYRDGPWGFADGRLLEGELNTAGFTDVHVGRDEVVVVFDDPDHLIRTLGAAPVGAQIDQLDPDDRRDFSEAVKQLTLSLIDDGAIRGVTTSHTATGIA